MKKEIEFQWSFEQQKAFEDIKDTLTKDEGPVLKFFDVSKPVTINCDASPTGLGAVLLQDGYPVAYTSRSLTETESRYAQIEKELLAVQFSLDRFHQYVYGKEVTVESDHKPLEMIAMKSLALAPPRLQRLLLRIQKYNYTIVYKPAKEMAVPDMLSRAPLPETDEEMEKEINLHIHLVNSTLPASEMKLNEIREATKSDDELRTLMNIIQNGWPNLREKILLSALPYWNICDELSVIDGIILKGNRIVVPSTMRKEMLQRIHYGHMGIEKSKRRARDAVYWPLLSQRIAEMVSKCNMCLEHRKENTKEPMIPFRIPTIPWEVVATDLFTLDNSDYLLIVDYYSRFFEVVKLPDTKSTTVITHSKSIFSRHGIPAEVVSDNGPQYSSKEYQAFADSWEFKHTTVSPVNPQANGLAERTVQTVKDLLVKSKKDQRDPYLSLLEYRSTPIDGVGSPAQLLMNRHLRSRVPQMSSQLKPRVPGPHEVKKKLNLKQQKQKFYYDRQSKPLPKIHEGDRVRVRMKGLWKPGVVTHKEVTPRSYRVKTDDGDEYRRNRKMLLKSAESDPALKDIFTDDFLSTRTRSTSSPENVEVQVNPIETPSQSSTIPEVIPPPTEVRTTSRGRIIKRLSRFNDFIMK